VSCNIQCQYCYQQPQRDAGNTVKSDYDLAAMKRAAELEGVGQHDGRGGRTNFSVFGGEPLLLPLADLEELLRWGVEDKGVRPGIQTNASLITPRHLDLFQNYGTGVGVSLDGPKDINRTRWLKDPETTDRVTAKSQANLEALLERKISTSLIVTVSSMNAGTDEKLDRTIAWLLDLRDKGLKYVNLHTLEVDTKAAISLALPDARSIEVMRRLRRELVGFAHVSPFADMWNALRQDGSANCVWNACDPLTTNAVRGVDGVGGRKNCGRTEKQGVSFMKADVPGNERTKILYLTPQEHGGCAGCRFFVACTGHCPGEAIDGDWRNRSTHCELITVLMTDMEADMLAQGIEPSSQSLRRPAMEAQLLGTSAGSPSPRGNVPHGDRPHGDHQDDNRPVVTHGDHTDAAKGQS
jgi:uncharacterized protein